MTYFYVGLICFVGGIFDIFCFGIITLNITLNNIYSLLRKNITIILQFNNITNKHHTLSGSGIGVKLLLFKTQPVFKQ